MIWGCPEWNGSPLKRNINKTLKESRALCYTLNSRTILKIFRIFYLALQPMRNFVPFRATPRQNINSIIIYNVCKHAQKFASNDRCKIQQRD